MKKLSLLCVAVMPGCIVFAQNVGIGSLTPTRAKFEVQGAVGTTSAIFGGDGQGISVQRNAPSIGYNQYFDGVNSRYIATGHAGVQWLDVVNGNMYIDLFGYGNANAVVTGTVRAITISKEGSVGIGNPPGLSARLSVARGNGGEGTAVFRGSNFNSHFNYSTAENTYIRGGKINSYVYLNNVGSADIQFGRETNLTRVGINSGNPFYALEIKQANGRGMIMVAPAFENWHFNVGPNTAQGSYHRLFYNEAANPLGSFHPQTGQYSAVSDGRLKTNIKTASPVLTRLDHLNPVQFEMKETGNLNKKKFGFIAQEMKEIFPGLVSVLSDSTSSLAIPDLHVMNYDGLSVYAIQIVQEQQEIIEELKKKIDHLKARKKHLGVMRTSYSQINKSN